MYFDRQLWAMTAGLRPRIALGVVLGLASLFVGIARFVFLGYMLALVFAGATWGAWLPHALAVAATVVLRAWLEQTRVMVAHRTAARVQQTLRARLFDRIAALGPANFAGSRTGGVMLSVIDGVEQLQSFFGQYLPQLFISICAPFAIFAVMAWWDLPVAGVMLGAALLALVAPGVVHRRNREAAIGRQRAMKSFGEEFLDAVQGLPTLEAFGQGRAHARMLAAKARALSVDTMRVLAAGLLARGISDFAVAAGAAVALALGVHRVTQGAMSLEALLIVLMAGTEIFRPLRDLRAVLHQGMVGQSAALGVHALLAAGSTAPAGGAPLLAGGRRDLDVSFEDVRFAYPGGRGAALDGLSLSVAAGERVGIVGPSGAGKSSIVRMLVRLHDPQAGRIRIGGHDLREVDPACVRANIAVVGQDACLFHGSVEDNIRLGRPDASDEAVQAAARAANAHEFIAALPEGYRTVIGERGARLSGGQRQRLAIARALLLDAPVLVLDEALSSVDAENEALIQQALDRLMQGRTTIVLAHRLSSVIGTDRIVVLEHGRVVQGGRHADLIAVEGPYRRLMGEQARGADAGTEPLSATITANSGDESLDGHGASAGDDAKLAVRDLAAEAAAVGWPATLRSLARCIAPWRGQLALTTLCGVGRVTALIGVGVLGALAIAAVKTGDDSGAMVWALLALAPLVGLLHWAESTLAHDMAYALLAQMRIDLFDKLQSLAPAYLLERRSGDLVALATQDVETVEYFFAHTVAPAFVAVMLPAVILLGLALVAWPLALVLLPFLCYAGLAPWLRRRWVDQQGSRARAALGALSAHLTETIQGLTDLMAFGAVDRRREAFVAQVREYQRERLGLLDDLARQTERLEAATGFGGLAVAVSGALLATHGWFEPALLPLLILVSVAAFLPVSEIAQVSRQLADTIASTRRLHVVDSEPVRVVGGRAAPPPASGGLAVAFDRVRFTYPGRRTPALAEVSFEVPAGATVALVGASGAGKSTIAHLLLRFWDPDAGTIRLGGVDVRDLDLAALRGRVALVAQDTYLFNDTLEANIRLARPQASPSQLALAIEQASLAEFVATLPEGLQTRVGERGVQLSGGQRQRVAIARAFLEDAPVLVLDEATSHLDAISETRVRAALAALMVGRTTLLIAHRLSTIRGADRILALDRGRIVESGTHAELMARRGYYARLVERQMAAARGAGVRSCI